MQRRDSPARWLGPPLRPTRLSEELAAAVHSELKYVYIHAVWYLRVC
jgi:hypothetical protein